MKLCICSGGNVRSVALARAFKEPAIAVGINRCEPDKFKILCQIADKIHICCSLNYSERLLIDTFLCAGSELIFHQEFMAGDRWGSPCHPELVAICEKIANGD